MILMENKQTAVEWLLEKVNNMINNGGDLGDDYPALLKHIDQAKQIEKQQIIDAWIATDNELQRIAAEKYYNQTFNQKKSSTELLYKNGSPMRSYHSKKIQELLDEMEQTPVEWLYNHLFPKQLDGFSENEWAKIDSAFAEAKKIEKIEQNKIYDHAFDYGVKFSQNETTEELPEVNLLCPKCQSYEWSYHLSLDKMKCGDCGHQD